jgi:hypothetical protein
MITPSSRPDLEPDGLSPWQFPPFVASSPLGISTLLRRSTGGRPVKIGAAGRSVGAAADRDDPRQAAIFKALAMPEPPRFLHLAPAAPAAS